MSKFENFFRKVNFACEKTFFDYRINNFETEVVAQSTVVFKSGVLVTISRKLGEPDYLVSVIDSHGNCVHLGRVVSILEPKWQKRLSKFVASLM